MLDEDETDVNAGFSVSVQIGNERDLVGKKVITLWFEDEKRQKVVERGIREGREKIRAALFNVTEKWIMGELYK